MSSRCLFLVSKHSKTCLSERYWNVDRLHRLSRCHMALNTGGAVCARVWVWVCVCACPALLHLGRASDLDCITKYICKKTKQLNLKERPTPLKRFTALYSKEQFGVYIIGIFLLLNSVNLKLKCRFPLKKADLWVLSVFCKSCLEDPLGTVW